MGRRGYNAEQIVRKLRDADVLLGQNMTLKRVCKQTGITDKTYYRLRKEYGGLKVDHAKRPKELEWENSQHKKLLAQAHLAKAILHEVAGGPRLRTA